MIPQTFRWAYPYFPKRTALLEQAVELIEELDLVQQLGEQIELQRSGPYAANLSDYLEAQLANLTKLKNVLAELKKCKENSLQAD